MALYRETATGFLCEFATNPGAGYSAISSMPTDTIDNKSAWHRGLDTYGQTSSWHPSTANAAEDPSPLALSISLSNTAHLVSADASGTVTDAYLGANTTVSVFRSSVNVFVSEGWALATAATNCTATISGATVTVTAMTADTAYVVITASRTGSPNLIATFSLAKSLRGATGANGTNGTNGSNGAAGTRGSVQILVSGSAWSDSAAWAGVVAQMGTAPVLSDMVTISNGTFSQSKFYAGGGNGTTTFGTWNVVTQYINGNLLVTGTIGADKLVAGSITTSQLNFTPVQAGGAASDINANGTTIDGSKITTGSIYADNIHAGTITADRIQATSLTSGQLSNNATLGTFVAGGAFTAANSANTSTYVTTIGTYASCTAPSGGRNVGSSGSITILVSGTLKSTNSAAYGWTIAIINKDTNAVLAYSDIMAPINLTVNYGLDFALIARDLGINDTETRNYTVRISSNTSAASGTTTVSYGIVALDTYK